MRAISELPFTELVFRAQTVHRECIRPDARCQVCTLLSIKTGGCPEDCAYCPQSAHYETGVTRQELMPLDELTRRRGAARRQRAPTRFCMGAAWRDVPNGRRSSTACSTWCAACAALGMEACCTLGMLDAASRRTRSADAGLTAYNHNLDTSPEFYGNDHHDAHLRRAPRRRWRACGRPASRVCCGGIIGMGEDRRRSAAGCCKQLATLDPHPESVPINMLVRVDGTPLGKRRAGGSAGAGAHDRDGAHPDAGSRSCA